MFFANDGFLDGHVGCFDVIFLYHTMYKIYCVIRVVIFLCNMYNIP